MPVHTEKRGTKWRVVEKSGQLSKTEKGKSRDSGGHTSKERAIAQVRAMNRKYWAK